jgi:nucleolar complex protein 3
LNCESTRIAVLNLERYSHLINLDFFPDLVNVLHNLATQALAEDVSDDSDVMDDEESDSGRGEDSGPAETKRLSPWQALHCVKTAFSVVSGQGKSLAIEPVRFFGLLYNALLAVNASKFS